MNAADIGRARGWANELGELIRNMDLPANHDAVLTNIRYLAERLASLNLDGATCLELMVLAERFYGDATWMHSHFTDAKAHHTYMLDCLKKVQAAIDAFASRTQ